MKKNYLWYTPNNGKKSRCWTIYKNPLDETNILVAVHFSMKNIYQSCDLGRAVGRSNDDASQ